LTNSNNKNPQNSWDNETEIKALLKTFDVEDHLCVISSSKRAPVLAPAGAIIAAMKLILGAKGE